MKNAGVLLLVGGLVVGGAVYVATKKKEETTPPPTAQPTALPSYVPDTLVQAYTRCYNGGCSDAEVASIQLQLRALMQEHPEAGPMFMYFATELQKRYPPTPAPQLPTDLAIKQTWQPTVDKCWAYECSGAEAEAMVDALRDIYTANLLDHPSVSTAISGVLDALYAHFGYAGTTGRSTGACCASCAAGGPCEGCGDEEPEPENRGVG